MLSGRISLLLRVLVAGIGLSLTGGVQGESPATGETLVIRLVHPERQAAEVLKLFDGARAAHPAAALAGWKRASRSPDQLGKPLEAVIATFNPEMAREWKVLDQAELRLDLSAADGNPRWYAVVPHDDGTLSAAITAQRLTAGSSEPPLNANGRSFEVERLGNAGSLLASRFGHTLILGSSRDELLVGLAARPMATGADHDRSREKPTNADADDRRDAGLVFRLDPLRMNERVGTIFNRRAAALFRGLGCLRIDGKLGLKGDLLALELTTSLGRRYQSKRASEPPAAAVNRSWLAWVPAERVMGVFSTVIEPGAAFWESSFALADRVERADPARAELAPLRSRFNLLAAAVGARPEVDLWPHLRGVTACVTGEPDQPGHPGGALVVLHTDDKASALQLATDFLPRFGSLLTAKKPKAEKAQRAAPGEPFQLGRVAGRSLLIFRDGRDVVIAWGEEVMTASRKAAANPERSVAPLCTDWLRAHKRPPQRVGAVWPARCWPSSSGLDTKTQAWCVLAQDPPALWWGWTDASQATDSLQFSGLRARVHDFLEQIPLDPSPLP